MKRLLVLLAACGGDDGASCPDYATIVGGTFARTGAMTTWTMEVAAIPATLTFNQAEVAANILEYGWWIEVDPNNDGEPDLNLAIKHFRMTDAPENTTTDILSVAQENLWTQMGASASISGSITASVSGNTLTFSVADSEDPLLPMVTMASQGTWMTFTRYGATIADQCQDTYKP